MTSLAVLDHPSTAALQTPLHLAVISSSLDNVKLLLSHGASVHLRDVFQHSILYYAARVGTEVGREIVENVIEAGGLLSEVEIERGSVGCEIIRAEARGLGAIEEVQSWKLALRDETSFAQAQSYARNLFSI